MKIKLELYGASRDLSNEDFLELKFKKEITIKDLKAEIMKLIDNDFKGNQNFKKIIEKSAFCSNDNNIISEKFIIKKDQKIGIIPPIGGG